MILLKLKPMSNLKNILTINKLPFLLGISLFVYLAMRIVHIAMTDDECITMQYHISESWWSVLTHGLENQGWAGNNHVLNSLFMKFEFLVFGKKDWALRLHILGAFAVCFYYTYKTIVQITPSPVRQFCYLALIFLNPYLIDFFGLARGYALSMAGWSIAFYYFTKYSQTPTLTHLRNVLIGLFIAIWANYSAFYTAFCFGLLFLYEFYRHRKTNFVKQHFMYLVVGYIVTFIVNMIPLYRTIVANNAYGGKIGIFQDMVVFSVERYVHRNENMNRFGHYTETWLTLEVLGMVALVVWALVQVLSFTVKTERISVRKLYYQALFVTLGIVFLVKMLFVFLGITLPMGRTNLLFSFPFFLCLIAAFDILVERYKAMKVLFIWVTPLLFWHFYICLNLDNTREWWQAGDAKRVISYMTHYIDTQKPQKVITLGGEGYQYFPLSFYAEPAYNDVLKVEFTELKKDGNFDFLFVPTFRNKEVWAGYEQIEVFKHGTLFKRKI
jgi:hypothetical protein